MNYDKSLEFMLKTFPEFEKSWEKHLEFWGDNPRTIGIDITAFSDYVAEKLERKEQYDYKKVFDFIEMLINVGDDSVQTAATTMFLENLLNNSSHGRFSSQNFLSYLGPKSIEYCRAWDEFCGITTEPVKD